MDLAQDSYTNTALLDDLGNEARAAEQFIRYAVRCAACGSDKAGKAVERPKDFECYAPGDLAFDVMRCRSCKSLFLNPQPTLAQTSSFYADDYMSKEAQGGLFRAMADAWDNRSARNFVKRFGPRSFILDYGCGDGSFVRKLRDAGCPNVYGFDPMKNGDGVYSNTEAIKAQGLKFDVIRMADSIEHLVDVDETMKELYSLLNDGGVVYGTTPNGAHPTSRAFGRFWGLLHYPYHTICFSPDGLKAGATRWGFSGVRIFSTLIPTGWAFSAEHVLKEWTKSKRRGHTNAYALLLLLSAPFVFLDRILPGPTTELAFELRS
jgi:2-polyprenyl-3-methyl-5-hydroxy-6-metoxy-1,4-benzoquinol methylase